MRRERVEDVAALVLDSYLAVAGGYESAYLAVLAEQPSPLLAEIGSGDVVLGVSPRALSMRVYFPGRRFDLVSKNLEVRLSRDATVAWVKDDISYRVVIDGRRLAIPVRATSVFELGDVRWAKVAEHVSYGLLDAEVRVGASQAARPGAAIPDETTPGPGGSEVRQILLGVLSSNREVTRRHFARGAGVSVVFSDPDRTAQDVAGPVESLAALYGAGWRTEPAGLQVVVGRSGTVAWALGNLRLVAPDGDRSTFLRASFVVERQVGGWQIVSAHLAAPVNREQLALRILGEALEPPAASD